MSRSKAALPAADPAGTSDAGRGTVPTGLRLSVTHHARWVAVDIAGELDESGGNALRSVAGQLARGGVHHVDLDLAGVTAADLHGVRALDEVRVALERAGTELRILRANLVDYPIDWHAIAHTPED